MRQHKDRVEIRGMDAACRDKIGGMGWLRAQVFPKAGIPEQRAELGGQAALQQG